MLFGCFSALFDILGGWCSGVGDTSETTISDPMSDQLADYSILQNSGSLFESSTGLTGSMFPGAQTAGFMSMTNMPVDSVVSIIPDTGGLPGTAATDITALQAAVAGMMLQDSASSTKDS